MQEKKAATMSCKLAIMSLAFYPRCRIGLALSYSGSFKGSIVLKSCGDWKKVLLANVKKLENETAVKHIFAFK